MHPRLEELSTYLDDQRRALRAVVDAVPAPRRSRRPAEDRWSVAETLEHLAIVEGSIASLISSTVAAARARGLGAETETSSALAMLDLARLRDRNRRVQASARATPTGTLDATAAWAALEASRERLRAAMHGADGLALGTLSAPNAALGPLNLYQWIAFVGAHEGRHALQIAETAAALDAADAQRA